MNAGEEERKAKTSKVVGAMQLLVLLVCECGYYAGKGNRQHTTNYCICIACVHCIYLIVIDYLRTRIFLYISMKLHGGLFEIFVLQTFSFRMV